MRFSAIVALASAAVVSAADMTVLVGDGGAVCRLFLPFCTSALIVYGSH
jgi:hypothetical protein